MSVELKNRKLTIVYIGNFSSQWTTENDYRVAFEHLGHKVIKMQENEVTVKQIRDEAVKSDMLLHTGTWGDALPLDEYLDMIHELAQLDIPTVTVHLDTFWSTGRDGRKFWREPMFHTAYLMTADGDYPDKWELLGKNHMWLAPAVRHDAAKFGVERPEYDCDVAFVGSNGQGYHEDVWSYRKELVDSIREICQRNKWTFKNPGGDDPKISRGGDMNDFYASAKITIGDSLCLKKEDSRYWSDRVPEATGRGGFLIMPHIKYMKFEWPDIPTYKWGNWKDLEKIMKYYMKRPDERHTLQFRNQANTAKNHTYVNRVETMLKIVGLTQ